MNLHKLLFVVLFAILQVNCSLGSWSSLSRRESRELKKSLKRKVDEMIEHSFQGYMKHAFPLDELKPISCTGEDTLGGYALTLVDALDLLAITGRHEEFRKHVKWVVDNVNFDRDICVSVFETNIRIVGGLIGAHFMYEYGIVEVDPQVDDYDGGLLRLAIDVADRLMPAFETATDIPYGTVNLQKGVPEKETEETSTASAGTFLLEMIILSCVTGDSKYELASRRAARALFERRSVIGLLGNHINITTGAWTVEVASIGTGIDSFIEYLIKAHMLCGDLEFLKMYQQLRRAFQKYCRRGEWYVEVNMHNGQVVAPFHNSLASFYAGNLVLGGYLQEAKETLAAVHSIFVRLGALPEGYNVHANMPQVGQKGYPLRPEHAESIYMLYQATRDPVYLKMGQEFVFALDSRTRVQCGFAALFDVDLGKPQRVDKMESFILSETLKYLYLLFDDSNPINQPGKWVFSTEGHPFPMSQEWNLDEWYDRRTHKASGGLPAEGHPLEGFNSTTIRCEGGGVSAPANFEKLLSADLLLWPYSPAFDDSV